MGQCALRCFTVVRRCRAVGVTPERVLAEMDEGERVMYAAGWRTPDGVMHYFDGPNPSLQALRGAVPNDDVRCWYHAESNCYCLTGGDAEVEEMMKSIDGCLCVEQDPPRAFLVRLDGEETTPVARWCGKAGAWVRKKPKG